MFLERTCQQKLTMYSCHNFVLARAAGTEEYCVKYGSGAAAVGLLCQDSVLFKKNIPVLQAVQLRLTVHPVDLCLVFPFILAGSPSHSVSNQRNQTSRPLKSSPSLVPSSANAPGKKLLVPQNNPLPSKTGKTYPSASFQKSSVHQCSVA